MSYIGSKPADAVLETDDITDGVITTSKLADNSVTTAKTSYQDAPFRNIIINGSMDIAQRGTSATGLGNNDSGYHTVDRFKFVENNAPTCEFTQTQSTDVPSGQGFAKSLKMDCTTAQTSLAGDDFIYMATNIEGQNLQYLKKGTSSAESLTLSFWVKSNKTGTYIFEIIDRDNSRAISKSYTISSASTWEKKTITLDGDTTGTLDNDNGQSFEVIFWLLAGANFQSGTLQTSWGSRTTTNDAVGQVNLADSTSNEWYITGVQLEAGEVASDFEFLPHDVNLQRCQRYYHEQGRTTTGNNYEGFCTITAYSGTASRGIFYLPTTMRSIPSFSSNGNFALVGGSAGSVTNITLADGGGNPAVSLNITASGMTAGDGFQLRSDNDADAFLAFDAEL